MTIAERVGGKLEFGGAARTPLRVSFSRASFARKKILQKFRKNDLFWGSDERDKCSSNSFIGEEIKKNPERARRGVVRNRDAFGKKRSSSHREVDGSKNPYLLHWEKCSKKGKSWGTYL